MSTGNKLDKDKKRKGTKLTDFNERKITVETVSTNYFNKK